jgi:secondary thiamine-phosphate synthase enzyme
LLARDSLCKAGFALPTTLNSMPEMRIYHQLEVRTRGNGLYEITNEVQSKLDERGVQNGTVTVFIQHTSCSVAIMENADPTARYDLEKFFERLVPEDADYFTHDSEGSDDMPSHIRMVLTRTSETVPIVDGRMQLGTWQGFSCSNTAGHRIGEKSSSPRSPNDHSSGLRPR